MLTDFNNILVILQLRKLANKWFIPFS